MAYAEKSGNKSTVPFKSKKDCEEKIAKYFDEHLSMIGEVADIESLADYLGSTRDELTVLMKDEKYGRQLRLARNRIAKIKKQLAFGGKIPAAVLSFDLKNNHGYRDKPEDDGLAESTAQKVIFSGKAEDWSQ